MGSDSAADALELFFDPCLEVGSSASAGEADAGERRTVALRAALAGAPSPSPRIERREKPWAAFPAWQNEVLRALLRETDSTVAIRRLRAHELQRTKERWTAARATHRALDEARRRIPEARAVAAYAPRLEMPSRPCVEPSALGAADWLLLDVWDTVLTRAIAHPTELFWFVGRAMKSATGLAPEAFRDRRIAAEGVVRAEAQQRGEADVRLDEIYARLAAESDWSEAQRDAIMAAEIAAERRFVRAHPLLAELRASGAPPVAAYVSEMYLPSTTMRELLAQVGAPVAPLFTSGETRRSKHKGALFQHTLHSLPAPAGAGLHLGDHPSHDLEGARAAGLAAALVQPPRPCLVEEDERIPSLHGVDSVCLGLARHLAGVESDPARRIGAELVGPMAWSFLNAIAHRAGAEGRRQLWFLARDGGWLREAWKTLPPGFRGAVETHDVWASRRLWGLAAIGDISAADWAFLLHPAPGMRAGDFFARVGIDPARFAERFAAHGLGSPEAVLVDRVGYREPGDRDRLYHLFVEQADALYAVIRPLRERVLAYLRTLPGTSDETLAVDLGWHGSSARQLTALAGALGRPAVPVQYFATWAESAAPEDSRRGVYLSEGAPAERFALLAPAVAVLEVLFAAPTDSPEDLRLEAGRWEPTGRSGKPTASGLAFQQAVWAGAGRFLEEMGTLFPEPVEETPRAYLDHALRRLLQRPAATEARLIGQLPHGESWGLPSQRTLLPDTAGLSDPAALVAAWEASGWRAGLLAVLSERQRETLAAQLGRLED